MRDTSLLAYEELRPVLNYRQQQVLKIIQNYPNISDLEISQLLGWPINSVTPRRGELEKLNLIKSNGKTRIEGRLRHVWKEKKDMSGRVCSG